MNYHFCKYESFILKVRFKIAMFVVKFTNFSTEKLDQQDIYPQLIPWYWVLIPQTKILDVRILLEYKKDKNLSSVIEMPILEVVQGLG